MPNLRPITVKETAKKLGINQMTVSQLIKQGVLPFGTVYKSKKGNDRYLIYESEVVEYMKSKGISV